MKDLKRCAFAGVFLLAVAPAWSNGSGDGENGYATVITVADNQPDLENGAGMLLAMGVEAFEEAHPGTRI